MGAAHARQQAITASRSAQSGIALSGVPATGGAAPAASALDRSAGSSPVVTGDDNISVVFTWTGGGQSVFLASSHSAWKDQIPMVRSGNEFSVVQEIPRGVHQYKFIVDDTWRFAPDQPKTQDSKGNMNNVCDVATYRHFEVDMPEDVAPRFTQLIPDPQSYMQDAPAVPTVLGKSAFCAVEKWWQGIGGNPPHIPTHSICDHVYLWQGTQGASNASDPTQLVVTHRYGKRYSTTVFATRRSPCLDVATPQGEGTPVARSERNMFKKAVIRPSR